MNESLLQSLDMGTEGLITLFLGFGAATLSLLFWKLSRAQSTNRL
ncbi:putative membrane protein [Synechococcus sp. BIOS-U3-1]|nr:putative membrane protein [Synechococcus sp. BIOS-U3-1]